MQPGATITPGTTDSPAPSQQPAETWSAQSSAADENAARWTASEYIAHHKPASWYAMLALGLAVIAGLILVLTGDKLSTGVIVFAGIVFGISAGRKPRTLEYEVGHQGVRIGEKFYPYLDFKSFSLKEEDAMYSIQLLPMRRFMPDISIYYPPDLEAAILNILANYLPHELRQDDMVDRLVKRLRF